MPPEYIHYGSHPANLEMKFVKALQARSGANQRPNCGLPLPTAQSFSAEEWTSAFRELGDGSADDQNAFEAGLFLFERLKRIRDELQAVNLRTPLTPAHERARDVCGLLNLQLIQVISMASERFSGDQHSIEGMSSLRWIGSHPGTQYTSTEAMEVLTEGARFPLRVLLSGKPVGSDGSSEEALSQDQSLFAAQALAQLYHSLESIWHSVQWEQARLQRRSRQYLFDETQHPLSAESALDSFRRTSRFTRDSRDPELQKIRRHVSGRRIPVLRDGKLDCLVLRELDEQLRIGAENVFLQREITTNNDLQAFLTVEHPMIRLAVGTILEAWTAIACLALQLTERSAGVQHIHEITANFGKQVIAEALAKCLDVSLQQAEFVVHRMTFGLGPEKGRHDELWDRPLVSVGGDVCLVLHALIGCDYTRLASRLAAESKELTTAHAERGYAFEGMVVQALRNVVEQAPPSFRKHVAMFGARIVPDDKSVGDIDGLLVVGDTAFVLECRSQKHAATPYEHWDVADDLLHKKGVQAIIKRKYLEADPRRIVALAQAQGLALPYRVTRFVAVVVSNSFIFEGSRDHEPYFIHIDTLLNILLTAGPRFGDLVDGQSVEYRVAYFDGDAKPGDAMLHAVRRPAKAEFYKSCMRIADFPIPGINENDLSGRLLSWRLSFPEVGGVKELLSRCSFSNLIQTTVVDDGA